MNYWIVRNRKFLTAGFIGVVISLVAGLGQLTIDPSLDRMLLNNDPIAQFQTEWREYFDTGENVLVAIDGRNWLHADNRERLDRVQADLEELPHVLKVTGLPSLSVVQAVTSGTADDVSVDGVHIIGILDSEASEDTLLQRVAADEWVNNIWVSTDGRTAVFAVLVDHNKSSGQNGREFVAALNVIVERYDEQGEWRTEVAGGPTFIDQLTQAIRADLSLFLPLCVLLLAIVLTIAYRAPIGTAITMLIVSTGVISTLGFMGWAGFPVATVTVILPPLLLVIGVTNVIHILHAYNEGRQQGHEDRADQMAAGLAIVLAPCTLSSLTTAIGFASLALNDVETIIQTGLLSCLGIVLTYLAAIILTPTLALNFEANKLVSSHDEHPGARPSKIVGYLHKTADLVIAKPWPTIVITLVLALLTSAGYSRLLIETDLRAYFDEDSPVNRTARFFQSRLAGSSAKKILVKIPDDATLYDPQVLSVVNQLEMWLDSHPIIDKAIGPAGLFKKVRSTLDGTPIEQTVPATTATANRQYFLWYDLSDTEILRQMYDPSNGAIAINLRAKLNSSRVQKAMLDDFEAWKTDNLPDGWQAGFADGASRFVFLVEKLVPNQIRSLAFAMLVIWIVLCITMRDIKLATLAMIPNIIPITAVMGFMGWVGIELTFATSMIPSIAIGLAVDDTLHVFSRYQLERKRLNNADAIRAMLVHAGRPVLLTSIVLFCGFIVLYGSGFRPNRYFGLLTAFTTVAAILADLYLAPALLYITGNDD